jgi:23S rRNA (guanosine2251-2'-O)-methyltransferase
VTRRGAPGWCGVAEVARKREAGDRPSDARERIYGRRPVAEAERGRRRVHRIWRAPETPADELERLCGSPEHQGVVAEVDPYPYADAEVLFASDDGQGLVVALDQIQDPHNLGAVCRAAEVAGAAGVVIPERRAAAVTPAACKASAGAVEHLPVARVRNLADWLAIAKEQGAWIHGADAEAEQRYTDVEWTGRAVLVLGSEGKGLRQRVAKACDELVSIPVSGKIGSLNASVAAAVILFEARRQRAA